MYIHVKFFTVGKKMFYLSSKINKLSSILFMAILFVLVFTTAFAQIVETPIGSQIFKQASPSVVLIEVYDEKGQVDGKGSGFVVTSDGKILTNYHVIAHTKKATVKLSNGDAYDTIDVIDIDKRKDIALIKIRAVDLPTLTLGKSGTTDVGEKIYCLGNPLGTLRNTLSEGIVSAIRAGDGYKYFQISAPISAGSSGSPVMNAKGEVVGIAFASIEEGQNLNFAIPIDYAKGMLTSNQIQSLASIYEPRQQQKTEQVTNDNSEKNNVSTKSTNVPVIPEEMLGKVASYLQRRINVLTVEEAKKLFGQVIKFRTYTDPNNLTHDVLGFNDPTKTFSVIELSFDSQTKKLDNILAYPANVRFKDLKQIFGEDDKKLRKKYPNGNKYYAYPAHKVSAITDNNDNVILIGYY